MIRQSYTAIVERNVTFEGAFATEPYECGWATEALFFIRTIASNGRVAGTRLGVQISPDGMHWCDEGSYATLFGQEVVFCRVSHFGNWLRLAGELPEGLAYG